MFSGPFDADQGASAAWLRLSADQAEERLGSAVAGADVDADGDMDLVLGSEGWTSNRGRAFLALGPLSGAVDLSAGAARFPGVASDGRLGGAVEVLGDLDDDGFLELGLGAWGADRETGAVWILAGGPGL